MWEWFRNLDIRKVAGAFSILTGIEALISHGDINLAGVPSHAADIIKIWCGNFVVINQVIVGGHILTAAKWPTPKNPTISNVAAIALILCASLLGTLLFLTQAIAADAQKPLPVKSPVAQQQAFTTGDGIYIGLSSEAAVANGGVSGLAIPPLTGGSVTATGGKIGFDVGYIKSVCIMSTWCQVEFDAKWQNVNGGNSSGSIQSSWSAGVEFDVGAGVVTDLLAQMGQNSPFPTFSGFDPTKLLPGWVKTTGAPRPYFGGIVEGYGISGTAIGTKSGQTIDFAAGLTMGTRWQLLNSAGQPSDSSVKVFLKYEWLNQGFDVTGILSAPGGAPPAIVHGGGQLNTLAAAGFNIDFGL